MADIGRNDPCHCGSGKKYKKCHIGKDEVKDRKDRQKAALNAAKVAEKKAKEDEKAGKKPQKQSWAKSLANKVGFFKDVTQKKQGAVRNKGG